MKWLNCFNRRCHLWVRPEAMLYSWPKSGWVIDVNGLKILREDPYLCWGYRNFFYFINKFFEKFLGRVLLSSPLHPLRASMPVVPDQLFHEHICNLFDIYNDSYDLIGCPKTIFTQTVFRSLFRFWMIEKLNFRWLPAGLG